MRTLVWFRNDLRVHDHPALFDAMDRGDAVAVFCLTNRQWRSHDVGDNRFAFLLDGLHALADELDSIGVPLKLVQAPWFDDLPTRLVNMAREVEADAIAFHEEYPLNERVRDSKVTRAFEDAGLTVHAHHAGTILPPGQVLTQAGEPYTVFTPFRRRLLELVDRQACEPLPAPRRQTRPKIDSDRPPQTLDGVTRDRVRERWPATESEAHRRLDTFIDERLKSYHHQRDLPAEDGTSSLSPYLSLGILSVRQCLHAAMTANGGRLKGGAKGAETWISELIWRDFYRHVIAQFPHVSKGHAFRRDMDAVPWRDAPAELDAWQAGHTGYPLVDAAMRQLAETGWMHNRLRMVSAMFLTKHLLIDWREGERHFMNLLVDGDFASNNGGWQWSASTGTDAAPYFRIFNPYTQAERFDPRGEFVRRYVSELGDVTGKAIFKPHTAGIDGYAKPIVDHAFARQRALEAFKEL
ncbi:MAG: deoxyribodipyrimidine photo-lyase [Pseudomonadales bacterium]